MCIKSKLEVLQGQNVVEKKSNNVKFINISRLIHCLVGFKSLKKKFTSQKKTANAQSKKRNK